MKKQILVIHGGETFNSYEDYVASLKGEVINLEYFKKRRWRKSLQQKLGQNFEVITPDMPNGWNAKYLEWKIWLEKIIPFLDNGVILVGHSLGGIFLAKYLSENNLPKKVRSLFLISAPFDEKDLDESLGDFILPQSLEGINKQAEEIFIYHSKDDPVVPFTDCLKFKNKLPNAEVVVFEDREHFNQEEFPELIEKIKKID